MAGAVKRTIPEHKRVTRIDKYELAYMMDCATRTISQYQQRTEDPLPIAELPRGGTSKTRYDLRDVYQWLLRQEMLKIGAVEPGKVYNIHREKGRLANAQADKAELEVEQLKHNLIPKELVVRTWQELVAAARAKLLAIPTKIAHAVAAAKELTEIENAIKEQIFEALNELASDGMPRSFEPEHSGDADGVEATAESGDKPVGGQVQTPKPRKRRRTRTVEDK